MKTLVRNIILTSFAMYVATANSAVYIAAHPDDVEYLMNKSASTDVSLRAPTVIVLLTAGDATYKGGIGTNIKGVPYYRARLKAHELTVRYWQGLPSAWGGPANPTVPTPTYTTESFDTNIAVAGATPIKVVEKVIMGNVVLYNMNLPDTSLLGLARGTYGFQDSISPVNRYGPDDIKYVLREIIRRNNVGVASVAVNFQDPGADLNPNDHGDHIGAGELVTAALNANTNFNCVSRLQYQGYDLTSNSASLVMTPDQLNVHIGTAGAINSGLVDNGNPSTWDTFHNAFFGRQYWRAGPGGGTCHF